MGSYEFIAFERTSAIKTSLDVEHFINNFVEYEENKDYSSLAGCSDAITKFAKEMFKKFPPAQGEFALPDKVAYATDESNSHVAEYSLGKNGIFCSFSELVTDEAWEYATSIADECNIGLDNFMYDGPFYGHDLELLKMRTETKDDAYAIWEDILRAINTLDDEKRGVSNRNNAFVTIWFNKNGVDEDEFIQCSPLYEKEGFWHSFLGSKKPLPIKGYDFEVKKNNTLYQNHIGSKERLIDLAKAWCFNRQVPDLSKYKVMMEF